MFSTFSHDDPRFSCHDGEACRSNAGLHVLGQPLYYFSSVLRIWDTFHTEFTAGDPRENPAALSRHLSLINIISRSTVYVVVLTYITLYKLK